MLSGLQMDPKLEQQKASALSVYLELIIRRKEELEKVYERRTFYFSTLRFAKPCEILKAAFCLRVIAKTRKLTIMFSALMCSFEGLRGTQFYSTLQRKLTAVCAPEWRARLGSRARERERERETEIKGESFEHIAELALCSRCK